MISASIDSRRFGGLAKGIVLLAFLGLVSSIGGGCGGGQPNATQTNVFNGAPAGIKSAWDSAVTAAKANDYAKAYLTLIDLRQVPGLSPQQIKAIDALSTQVNDNMSKAAANGDKNAMEAVQKIREAMMLSRGH
jgi:hypothetical protein